MPEVPLFPAGSAKGVRQSFPQIGTALHQGHGVPLLDVKRHGAGIRLR